MNELEQIIGTIRSDAQAEADARIAQAKARAQEIVAQAEREIAAQDAERDALAQKRAQAVVSAAESGGALTKRSEMLRARREAIDRVTKRVLDTLCTLPDAEYFDALARLIAKNAGSEPGTLILNERDRARLPADFLGRLGAPLALAEKTRELCGGCVLQYGEVEVNLAFDAILEAEREQIEDLICRALF